MKKFKFSRSTCCWKASLLLTAIFLALAPGSFAQERTVRGTVTDTDGATLPGVTVLVEGTTIGTATGLDGSYSLTVPGPDAVLVFSFVGYIAEEEAVADRTVINVTLIPRIEVLEEMVVVGYGTRMREELTGAVATVTAAQMEVSTAPSVVARLQGLVSGVTVTQARRPGASAIMRIRGIGTINDASPLFIIDGVPTGPGNNLNADDIESITVLKDASSAAIYGTRGANGVVIITTKRGQRNQAPRVDFSFRTGVNNVVAHYDLLNTQEYAEALWLSFRNRGMAPSHPQFGSGATPVIPDYILPSGTMSGAPTVNPALYRYPEYQIFRANKTGTNWFDEIDRPGWQQEYHLSVTGGGENHNYAFSGSYLDEDGYLIHSNFKRYNLRMNADARLTDWLQVGESLQLIYIDEYGNFGDNAESSPISWTYRAQPIIPVYDIGGNFGGSRAAGMGNSQNAVAVMYRAQDNVGNWARMLGNVYAEANPLQNLTIRSLFGFNWGQWNFKGHTIPNHEHSEPTRVNAMWADSNFTLQWNFTNTVNYTATLFNDHRLSLLAGTEAVESDHRFLNASRSRFFFEDPNYMQLSAGEAAIANSGNSSSWSLMSQFGRINYDIGTRYFIEASVRRDGSSRFAEAHRFGIFPAFSAAWAISEEGFMDGTNNWLDMLRLRLGWGVTGNDQMGLYNAFTTFVSDPYRSAYAITGSNTVAVPGFMPSALGNEEVTWEETATTNLGIDGELLGGRFTFAFDTWFRRTSDMLFAKPIPYVAGALTAPSINIAEMNNTGFDLQLGYNDWALGDRLNYNITLTVSHYTNEVVDLIGDPDLVLDGQWEREMVYTRFGVGSAFPEFFGFIVDGIFQTAEEAAAHPRFGTTDYNRPGHYKFRDVNEDGTITPDDRTWIGSPHPDFVGGLNFDLNYGSWDLNLFFYGSYGNEMVNYVSRWIDYGMFHGGLSRRALYETWGSPHLANNADATLPMLNFNVISQQPSTAFLEDGSYLRLRNLRLGYTVPRRALESIGFGEQSVRAYVQVSNVFTLTNYSGLDPEINLTGIAMGLDRGAWPTARMITFGLHLGI